MKWNFIEYKCYDWNDEHLSSEFIHRGIGHIKVSYTVDYSDKQKKSTVCLYCGDRLKRSLDCHRGKAKYEAKRMYLNFVKDKITNDDVVVKAGNNFQIVDINTGLSITLSKKGIAKLDSVARKYL